MGGGDQGHSGSQASRGEERHQASVSSVHTGICSDRRCLLGPCPVVYTGHYRKSFLFIHVLLAVGGPLPESWAPRGHQASLCCSCDMRREETLIPQPSLPRDQGGSLGQRRAGDTSSLGHTVCGSAAPNHDQREAEAGSVRTRLHLHSLSITFTLFLLKESLFLHFFF